MKTHKEEITGILNEEQFVFKFYAFVNQSAFQMVKSKHAKVMNISIIKLVLFYVEIVFHDNYFKNIYNFWSLYFLLYCHVFWEV